MARAAPSRKQKRTQKTTRKTQRRSTDEAPSTAFLRDLVTQKVLVSVVGDAEYGGIFEWFDEHGVGLKTDMGPVYVERRNILTICQAAHTQQGRRSWMGTDGIDDPLQG